MTIYLYIFQVFEQGGTVTTVSNFPSFERSLNEFFPGQVTSIKNFLGRYHKELLSLSSCVYVCVLMNHCASG